MGMYMEFLYLPVFLGTIIIMLRFWVKFVCPKSVKRMSIPVIVMDPYLHHDSAPKNRASQDMVGDERSNLLMDGFCWMHHWPAQR